MNQTALGENQENSFIGGVPTSNKFAYFRVHLHTCDNTTNSSQNLQLSQECASKLDIQSQMQSGTISYAFSDRLLDQAVAGNPYDIVVKQVQNSLNLNTLTSTITILRHSYFDDQTNFYYYFPSNTLYHVLSLVSTFTTTTQAHNDFFSLALYLDDKSEYYYRTYATFYDVLGNIGGFQTCLQFIFSILVSPIAKLRQNLWLINSIFAFEEEGQIPSRASTTKRLQSQQPLRNQARSLKQFIKQKDRKLRLNLLQSITLLCSREKKQMLQEGIKKIEIQLDITTILLKLFEIEKLKYFLLDENQLKLFEYIPKPVIRGKKDPQPNKVIPLTENKRSVEYFANEMEFDTRVGQALQSYRMLRDSNDQNNIKLIQMMDDDIKILFETIIESPQIRSRLQSANILSNDGDDGLTQ